ncbi:hypothetical protein DUI87_09224 [Hirundo rustica rustica]|uniref:Uncharacterized protein n=1 Tax=Hirundo rustica rustica TaxID=333673 RepID=A0A3M0KM17_HIRRU|nr:hypothetical protein DUI87_09224 [Hirundo rustica rustica]
MSNCLLSLVASLPGIIVFCGLIALFCIVLFDTTPAHGQRKTVKEFREPGKIERYIRYVIAKPNTPPEDTEFDTGALLVKVEEVNPDSNVGHLIDLSRVKKNVVDPEGTWYSLGFQDFVGITKARLDISIQESNIT